MSGNFDMGYVQVTIDGTPLDNVLEVVFPKSSNKNLKPIMTGGGRALGHTKQSKANNRMVRVRMAHPSADEARLALLAADQTDIAFAFAILPPVSDQLPDGARLKFTSAQAVVEDGDQDYKDEPGVREYTLSCIGFREEFKNSPAVVRV